MPYEIISDWVDRGYIEGVLPNPTVPRTVNGRVLPCYQVKRSAIKDAL